MAMNDRLSGRYPKRTYVHQYGPLQVSVKWGGKAYLTTIRSADGYEATVETFGSSTSAIEAAREAISSLYDSYKGSPFEHPKTEYEKGMTQIAMELGPDIEEAYAEMDMASHPDDEHDRDYGHTLSGKKRKPGDDKKEYVRKILKNSTYIEEVAWKMYDRGERVSITNVYHAVKGKLGLPGAYDFDLGDAIRSILKDANWQLG